MDIILKNVTADDYVQQIEIEAVLDPFTIEMITLSGNTSLTDAQKVALNNFFIDSGATGNTGWWSKTSKVFLPMIAADISKSLVDYKNNTVAANPSSTDYTLNDGLIPNGANLQSIVIGNGVLPVAGFFGAGIFKTVTADNTYHTMYLLGNWPTHDPNYPYDFQLYQQQTNALLMPSYFGLYTDGAATFDRNGLFQSAADNVYLTSLNSALDTIYTVSSSGTLLSSSLTKVSAPPSGVSGDIYLFGNYSHKTASWNRELCGFAYGSGLTQAEAIQCYNDFKALATAFGIS